MASPLVTAYEHYCQCQTVEDYPEPPLSQVRRLMLALASNSPRELHEFQTQNDQLFAIWRRYVGRSTSPDFREFATSGSTRNTSRRYVCGPYPELWIRVLWSHSRFPLGYRELVLLESCHDRLAPLTFLQTPGAQYPYVIKCGPLNFQVMAELIKVFQRVLDEQPACTLITVPDVLLYLNDQPAFHEFVTTHRDRFSLASQHWEPFYKRRDLRANGVHINDVMTDWTTGFNFYTCPAGRQHTFQMFAMGEGRRVNLLNLMGAGPNTTSADEDLVAPRQVVQCGCGRYRMEFDFVPHPSNAIRTQDGHIVFDPDLAEYLSSQYCGLQFLQENDTITVVYRVDGDFRDADRLELYFARLGFRLNWMPNDVYPVGPKRPVFYRFS